MAALGIITLLLMALFWKEFKLLSFDPEFGASLGFPIRAIDILLTTLLVIAIVIGLQTVGVVLMSAMVVAPAAAARQWTNRLSVMVALSAVFGALAGITGSLISSSISRMPTGPTIVLCISVIVIVSLLFAPGRGLAWRWVHHQRNRRQLRVRAVLADLYALAAQHEGTDHGHTLAVLRAMSGDIGGVQRTVRELHQQGLVRQVNGDKWALTEAGIVRAQEEVNQQ
jgi:manganese/zinc/iron transport system permease protein